MLRFMFKDIEHHEQPVITPASSRHAARSGRICETHLLHVGELTKGIHGPDH